MNGAPGVDRPQTVFGHRIACILRMPKVMHVSRRAYDVPPLELLVAFEAAARHLSFTRAGDEIALTQSAVSRQIQALEDRFGVALFRRLHRALVLTEEGRVFQQATTEALAAIDRASRALREGGETRPVVVSTTAGFAGVWLIPRLTSFVAAHPEVDVRISTGNTLANLERDGVDVAVRYRSVDLLPAGAVPLFGETVFPVCSPRLLRAAGAALKVPADLAGQTLLRMEPDGSNHLQDWGLWLHAMELTQLKPAGGAALLLLRPADPGSGRRPGRRARPGAADRPPAEGEEAGRAVRRRRGLAEGLLHAGRDRRGAAPGGRGLHRVAGGGSTRPGFSTSAGSSAALIARIIASATGDLRVPISSSFSRPMPCSAEIEPLQAPTAS